MCGSIKLVFYKARYGNILDKIISLLTVSKYSHVEIVSSNIMYSASPRDYGVRCKLYKPSNKWDAVELKDADISLLAEFYRETIGCKYDLIGILIDFILKRENTNNRYYCSEWVSIALNKLYSINLNSHCTPKQLYQQVQIARKNGKL